MSNLIKLNVQQYSDPDTGKVLGGGSLFFGEIDLDPLIEGNRKTVVIREEDGTETSILPAAQPIKLGVGGYPTFNGSVIAGLFIDGNYSFKGLDANDVQAFFNPNAFGVPAVTDIDVKSFENVADMITDVTLLEGTTIQTRGYYASGDDGGNLYKIVASGTGTDDGGSFIDLSGSGTQAQAIFANGNIYIRQFGAKGDGVTDDLGSIQAAINYINGLVLKRKLNFNEGVFLISGALQFRQSITYQGNPEGTLISVSGAAPVNTNAIEFATNADDVIIKDLRIQGTGKESSGQPDIDDLTIGNGILLPGITQFSRRPKFYNLSIRDCKVGINLRTRDGAVGIVVRDCNFEQNSYAAIVASATTGLIIDSIYIDGERFANPNGLYGINLLPRVDATNNTGNQNITIKNIYSKNSLLIDVYIRAQGGTIDNIQLKDPAAEGLVIEPWLEDAGIGNEDAFVNLSVSNINIDSAQGIAIRASHHIGVHLRNPRRITFSNLMITNSNDVCLEIGHTDDIETKAAADVIVNGAILEKIGTNGLGTISVVHGNGLAFNNIITPRSLTGIIEPGIFLKNVNDSSISGVILRGSSAVGNKGIDVTGTSINILINGNIFSDINADAIQINGSSGVDDIQIGNNSFANVSSAVTLINNPLGVSLLQNMYGTGDVESKTTNLDADDQNIKITFARVLSGADTPLGNVTGSIGDIYLRSDGSTNTTFYVKESGTDSQAGWNAK